MKRVSVKWRIGLGVVAAAAVAAGFVGSVAGDGQTVPGQPSPNASVEAGGIQLVAFDSCESALREFRGAARPYVSAFGFGSSQLRQTRTDSAEDSTGATPSRQAPAQESDKEHSTTNNHEVGVDEPDIVKTDGVRVVAVAGGKLRIIDAASRTITGTVALPQGSAAELLVDGDRALVLMSSLTRYKEQDSEVAPAASGDATLALVDLAGAKVLSTLEVDGSYLDARKVGSVARVVVHSRPTLKFQYPHGNSPSDLEQGKQQNLGVVERSTIEDWLPGYTLTTGATKQSGRLVDCARVSHPVDYSATSTLTVLSFDLHKDLGTGDPVSIAADGNTVYGSGPNLYVADDHRLTPEVGDTPPKRPGADTARTAIYQFDVSKPGPPVYTASGAVAGTLLDQYSLSEHADHLRVATTLSGPVECCDKPASSENAVTVLERQGDKLTEVGRLGGLGVGERIYAVRFIGDRGYVVTFRQTDPLYSLDLSDPRKPRATGELKITGYSAYLHDAGDGKLIGIGQEATEAGKRLGTQVSVFDVKDPAAPARIAQYQVQGGHSEIESDPHAFLYWPKTGMLVVPVVPSGATESGSTAAGAVVLRLADGKLTEQGMVSHPVNGSQGIAGTVRRALVIGDDLWTMSEAGVLVSNPVSGATIAQSAWLPFS